MYLLLATVVLVVATCNSGTVFRGQSPSPLTGMFFFFLRIFLRPGIMFEGFKPEFWKWGFGGTLFLVCKFVCLFVCKFVCPVQGLLLFVKIIINQLFPVLFVYTNPTCSI
jgi:hypothetical protein